MKQNTYKTFKRYIRRTWKNKLWSIGIVGLGVFTMTIDNDATVLVFALILGIPTFFAKRNHIC